MKKKPMPPDESFNAYAVIEKLRATDLLIKTIPGEEWMLSYTPRTGIYAEVYTLSGQIAGTNKTYTYKDASLCEIILQLLRYGRKAQYQCHVPTDENITEIPQRHVRITEFEYDARLRLKSGDLFFYIIPQQTWRLSNTWFGDTVSPEFCRVFHFANAETLRTSTPIIFRSTELSHVLLEFLCQRSEFMLQPLADNVLPFRWKSIDGDEVVE